MTPTPLNKTNRRDILRMAYRLSEPAYKNYRLYVFIHHLCQVDVKTAFQICDECGWDKGKIYKDGILP